MPVQSNELPERSLTRDFSGNWVGTRAWLVTGATDENQCFTATPMDGKPVAQQGEGHPLSSLMIAQTVTPTQTDAFAWKVVANYVTRKEDLLSGGDPGLLLRPAIYSLKRGQISVQIDTDRDGLSITNSALDALNPPLIRPLKVRYLTVTRYEPFYDSDKADAFENTVNAGAVIIGGKLLVPQYRMYCEGIDVAEDFPANAIAIPVQYSFIIRKDPNDVESPFDAYTKDQGRRGWYDDGGKPKSGEFFHDDGTQCSDDIALDGTGRPIDPSIKVGKQLADPISTPDLPDINVDPKLGGGRIKFLKWNVVGSTNFLALGL